MTFERPRRDQDDAAHVVRFDKRAAASNCSGSSRFQAREDAKTLLRHWSCAMATPPSSSSSHDRWTCKKIGLPSPPPARNESKTARSRVERLVDRDESVRPAADRARGVGSSRPRRRDRGVDRRQIPQPRPIDLDESVVRHLLAGSSARMTSTHSSRRASRVALSGQRSPVTCSLIASPEPRAAQNRPGNSRPAWRSPARG